jgi:CheY-like chemotaxis protein
MPGYGRCCHAERAPQTIAEGPAQMSALSRILLVEDSPAEWQLALASFAENGLMDQATVVKDKDEALDFLHARGSFRRRSAGLPAVVVIGPSIQRAPGISLLKDIRTDAVLRRVPVVVMASAPDGETAKAAYAQGANSVVPADDDLRVHAERYAALALFWGWANEPPPGCVPQPKSQRRDQ